MAKRRLKPSQKRERIQLALFLVAVPVVVAAAALLGHVLYAISRNNI